ncbi:MAG TPA: hypothetical protein VJT31_32710 [Rugosimonospora sp.]|nr:hypothetical protein [Rugosimonospora sp.]
MTWLDVLGWAGSGLLVWSLLQSRLLRLRALNFVGCLTLIGYNAAVRVWPMVGLNVVLAAINLWYLAGMLLTRHDQRRYQVVQVGTDDDFLGYVLTTHATDIARYNPGFQWRSGPDRSAYLVLLGDDLVGVVLLRALDQTTAQVELDYVTRRFRDFTPGEFVYRRSHLFTDRGFRRIITPPGMIAPYYHRLGFRKAGDSYILEW